MSRSKSAAKPIIRAIIGTFLVILVFIILIPKMYNAIYDSSGIAFFTAIGTADYIIPVILLLVLTFFRNITYRRKVTYILSALCISTLIPMTYQLLNSGIFNAQIGVAGQTFPLNITFTPVVSAIMASEALISVSRIIRFFEVSANASVEI